MTLLIVYAVVAFLLEVWVIMIPLPQHDVATRRTAAAFIGFTWPLLAAIALVAMIELSLMVIAAVVLCAYREAQERR